MKDLFDFARPDRARSSDPVSSHEAVPSFVDRRSRKYKQALTACRALASRGEHSSEGIFCDDDIEEWCEKRYGDDLNRNDVAKRRLGVENDRYIFRVGIKPRKGDGHKVMHFRWRVTEDPPVIDGTATTKTSLKARLMACEQVEADYVEHVRYEGHDYYLASDLLEALMEGHE